MVTHPVIIESDIETQNFPVSATRGREGKKLIDIKLICLKNLSGEIRKNIKEIKINITE